MRGVDDDDRAFAGARCELLCRGWLEKVLKSWFLADPVFAVL
jgi:hypothetical protein